MRLAAHRQAVESDRSIRLYENLPPSRFGLDRLSLCPTKYRTCFQRERLLGLIANGGPHLASSRFRGRALQVRDFDLLAQRSSADEHDAVARTADRCAAGKHNRQGDESRG